MPRRRSPRKRLGVRGLFVTGTDTGVGKTVVAGAMAAVLRTRGQRVAAWKPALTGLEEPPQPGWPRDHEMLAAITGQTPGSVAPHRFGPAVSPHLAAEIAGAQLDPAALVASAREAAEGSEVMIGEGVGGLLVPLAADHSVRDLACALALPLVIAARTGLGTINHTLLTLEAARSAGLRVVGEVMTPWPAKPSAMEESNRATIAAIGEVEVAVLPRVPSASIDDLAQAGAALPVERWLDPGSDSS
jgi:dethiobiotin synthetase